MQTDFEQIESGTFIFDLFSRTRYLLPPVSADNRRPGGCSQGAIVASSRLSRRLRIRRTGGMWHS